MAKLYGADAVKLQTYTATKTLIQRKNILNLKMDCGKIIIYGTCIIKQKPH